MCCFPTRWGSSETPHDLVDAFKATLEEVIEGDLLLQSWISVPPRRRNKSRR
ncbi:MAG: hypothetical protein Ct9H300mP32_6630 [Verrucomicrobiota bacterium]|nr:MAG: hypothetical protein Ct9H300mP32_6630 [Verrucomicrobiota bacterium]